MTRRTGYAIHSLRREGTFHFNVAVDRKRMLLGAVRAERFEPNTLGLLVTRCIEEHIFETRGTQSHVFQVMPNHFHLVAVLNRSGPTVRTFIGSLKARCTRAAYRAGVGIEHMPLWQRGSWPTEILSERQLARTCDYVLANPSRWGR